MKIRISRVPQGDYNVSLVLTRREAENLPYDPRHPGQNVRRTELEIGYNTHAQTKHIASDTGGANHCREWFRTDFCGVFEELLGVKLNPGEAKEFNLTLAKGKKGGN